MRKVELAYLEVMNETEQFMVFQTTFNKKEYGQSLMLNTALPVQVQDIQIERTVRTLETITAKKLDKVR